METQSLESAQLKREKAIVENDLLKTQVSNKRALLIQVVTDALRSFVYICLNVNVTPPFFRHP